MNRCGHGHLACQFPINVTVPFGNQIRGQGRKRLPKTGRVDCGSTGRSQSLARSTSGVMAVGAGPKTQARLHQLGLHTIGDVARADPRLLSVKLGRAGVHFHTLAHAEDPRPVIGGRASRSIGSEHTLDEDVREKADIKFHLRRSADTIGRRLRKKSYVAFGVGIKLKTAEFQILSRQHQLSEPTDVAERLYSVGVDLLRHIDHPGPFRLIGLVACDLVDIDDVVQLGLFSTLARQRKLEVAIDGLADRFGTNVVHRADDLNKAAVRRWSPTLDFLDDRAHD